jgi:hypothetical protein
VGCLLAFLVVLIRSIFLAQPGGDSTHRRRVNLRSYHAGSELGPSYCGVISGCIGWGWGSLSGSTLRGECTRSWCWRRGKGRRSGLVGDDRITEYFDDAMDVGSLGCEPVGPGCREKGGGKKKGGCGYVGVRSPQVPSEVLRSSISFHG